MTMRLKRNGRASSEHAQRRLQLMKERAQADLDHGLAQKLGWRDGVVLSWSAMRGVVTLAAAQSIPATVPYRPQIILIAFLVAVLTLLLHGLTLPALIRKLWPEGVASGIDATEIEALSRDLIESGVEAIDDELTNEAEDPARTITPDISVDRAKSSARNSLAPLVMHAMGQQHDEHVEETPAEAYVRLARIALEAQRSTLLEERAIGRYSSKALHVAEMALDAHENRLAPYKHD